MSLGYAMCEILEKNCVPLDIKEMAWKHLKKCEWGEHTASGPSLKRIVSIVAQNSWIFQNQICDMIKNKKKRFYNMDLIYAILEAEDTKLKTLKSQLISKLQNSEKISLKECQKRIQNLHYDLEHFERK